MPTNNAKVFRLIRPAVAAIQVKLATAGLFEGSINGLYGPSTREAAAAYQRKAGGTVTGLVSLETSLALLDLDPQAMLLKYANRLQIGSTVEMRRHAGMPEVKETKIEGDPEEAKSLMMMSMPGRENDHTRAVRSLRELVGGFQIKLAEHGFYDGPIDGLPDSPRTRRAIQAYQSGQNLKSSEQLDLWTALALLELDGSEVRSRYGDRINLHGSPVARTGSGRNSPQGERKE